jgi:hypothetical protein
MVGVVPPLLELEPPPQPVINIAAQTTQRAHQDLLDISVHPRCTFRFGGDGIRRTTGCICTTICGKSVETVMKLGPFARSDDACISFIIRYIAGVRTNDPGGLVSQDAMVWGRALPACVQSELGRLAPVGRGLSPPILISCRDFAAVRGTRGYPGES